MKHQTVYVPVMMSDEIPPPDTECYFTKTVRNDNHGDIMSSHLWNFNGKEGWDEEEQYEPPNCWLKPIENVNILTDSELLELKKKWMEEAMDEGAFIQQEGKNEDREQFLNNLKLD